MLSSRGYNQRSRRSKPPANEVAESQDLSDGQDPSGATAQGACDPFGLYLRQIGRYPLLSVAEERVLASRVYRARKVYRFLLLDNHLVLTSVSELLESIHGRRRRVDRLLDVSNRDAAQKKGLAAALNMNLATMEHLLAENEFAFSKVRRQSTSSAMRSRLCRVIARRRRKCVRLVEELRIRVEKLVPFRKRLLAVNADVANCLEELNETERSRNGTGSGTQKPCIVELRERLTVIENHLLEQPSALA